MTDEFADLDVHTLLDDHPKPWRYMTAEERHDAIAQLRGIARKAAEAMAEEINGELARRAVPYVFRVSFTIEAMAEPAAQAATTT